MTDGSGPEDGEFLLRLREPLDVLGAVPYLLGYQPRDSIVLIGLSDWRLHVTTRADLPIDAGDLAATTDGLYEMLSGTPVDSAIVVGYGPEEHIRPLLPRLTSTLERLGITLFEVIRAHDGHYWSYLCPDPHCCRPEGTPYDIRDSRVAAEATLAGLPTMPDQATYERQVEPIGGAARQAMAQATVQAHEQLFRLVTEAVDEDDLCARLYQAGQDAISAGLAAHAAGGTLDDDAAAWLIVLVSYVEVRDLAIDRLGGSRSEWLVSRSLWLDLLRRAEPDLVPAVGTVFALGAWQRGDLILARLAIERALAEDPEYPLARLVDNAIAHGLRPLPPEQSTVEPSRRSRVRRRPGRRPRRRSSSPRAGSPPA